MKVVLCVGRAGVGFSQNPGDEIEVSDREGKALIDSGQAVPSRINKTERAVKKSKAEKAIK